MAIMHKIYSALVINPWGRFIDFLGLGTGAYFGGKVSESGEQFYCKIVVPEGGDPLYPTTRFFCRKPPTETAIQKRP